LHDVNLFDPMTFEVKKNSRILNNQFSRKGRTSDIKYTGTI